MDLPNDIASCHALIRKLCAEHSQELLLLTNLVKSLQVQVEQLQQQLNQNSGNSHQPPCRVNHFEETPIAWNGQSAYLHVCSTAEYTYLFAHPSRGKAALWSADSLLPHYKGWAQQMHDLLMYIYQYSQQGRSNLPKVVFERLRNVLDNGSIQWGLPK